MRHYMFVEGDVACALGAIKAGCRFYAAYPITPASEIMNTMAQLLPKEGGKFVQMEDELASIAAAIGASWTGVKAMTATSGPGFSLMQENLGYALMTETPIVLVNIMRSGPSIGQATMPAQGDVMQSRFGSHGDYELIVLAPNSVQEMFDFTVKAFNFAELYRIPVIVLADAAIGHMRERLEVHDVTIINRKVAKTREEFIDYSGDVPPMPLLGSGLEILVTGSTHKPDGVRDTGSASVHSALVNRLVTKIEKHRDAIEDYEELYTDNAEILVIAYGAPSRPAKGAVIKARAAGIKAGYLRPKVLWPAPEKKLQKLAKTVKSVILPELSLRGYKLELEKMFGNKLIHLPKLGGLIHTVDEIYQKIKEVNKK